MEIADYRDAVGSEVGVSNWILIDQVRIDAFAQVTEDQQFIHTDPERAKEETPFAGTIAHGFLTLSLLVHMSIEAVPDPANLKTKINYGLNKLRFLSPVPEGSKVRGRFTLAKLDERDGGVIDLQWHVTVEIENTEKPALVAEWLTRLYV